MHADREQPSPGDWAAYLSGRLDDAQARQIEAWLDEHGVSPEYAEQAALMQDDSFLKRIRQSAHAVGENKSDHGLFPPDLSIEPGPSEVARLLQTWPELINANGRSEPQPDQRIGRYLVLQRVSQTRMGQVFRCLDESTGRLFALKCPPQVLGERTVERFQREIKITQKLKHPQIVTVVDELQYQNQPVFVMPWVDGIDLGRLLARAGQLSQADVAEIGAQVASILKYLAKNGVVHRDIKPSNLMLTKSGAVTLIDLGLALLSHSEMTDETLTESVQIIGSLDYLAPEQARNAHAADFRADIYSLGCTLFKLATGRGPFEQAGERHALQKIMAHALDPFPDLSLEFAEFSSPFAELLRQLCAKQSDERLTDLDEIASRLKQMASGSDLRQLYLNHAEEVSEVVGFNASARSRPRLGRVGPSRRALIGLGAAVAAGAVGVSQRGLIREYFRRFQGTTDFLFAESPQKWLSPHSVFIVDGNLSSIHVIDYQRNFEVTRFTPEYSGWNLAVTRSGKLFVANSEGEICSVDLRTNRGREHPNLRLDQGMPQLQGSGSGGMDYVDAKSLYVTGRHSGRLYKIDTTTMQFDQTFGERGFVQVEPMSLSVTHDQSGILYVSSHSGVAKISADGKRVNRNFITGLQRVTSLSGFSRYFPNLFVVSENRVMRYSDEGKLISPRFIVWDRLIDHILVDRELDLLYISNYSYSDRVDVYKIDGRGIPYRQIPKVGLNLAQMALPVAD